MTPADWIIAGVLLVSGLQAAWRGIFVEVFALGGIVVGVGVASWNYMRLLPWVARWVHTPAFAAVVSFLLIALGIMVVAGLLGRILRWSIRSIGLGWADRFLGAIFGLLRGAVLVTLGVMLVVAFWPQSTVLHNSRLAPYFVAMARGSTVGTPATLRDKVRYGARLLSGYLPGVQEWEPGR